MPDKIKILYIINSLDYGGAEKHLLDLVTHLNQARFTSEVVYLRGKGELLREFQQAGIPVRKIPLRNYFDFTVIFRLYRFIKNNPARIVHTHLFLADSYGGIAARLSGVKTIISTRHNTDRYLNNPILALAAYFIAKLDNFIIVISQAVRKFIQSRLRVGDKKIYTIYYGLETNVNIEPTNIRSRFNIKDCFLVGCVCRFRKQKGLIYLLKAAKEISKKYTGIKFILVGTGPQESELKKAVKELGIEDAVIFAGLRSDILNIMAELDVFVLPSFWEGFGRVLLEAMMAGLPIVATRVGGIPEIVVDGSTGILVPPADEKSLAEAILRLFKNKELAKKMAEVARERFLKYFTIDKMIKETEAFYERALGFPA